MHTRLILYIAYSLKASLRYQRCKAFFYDLLENPQSNLKSYFDIFMICLVISSISLLLYEVEHQTFKWAAIFERFVVTVFIIEYLLRGWVYSDIHSAIIKQHENSEYLGTPFRLHNVLGEILAEKFSYIFSPSAIIDLLAILPSYRPLRILRIFLVFRLLKLFRYSQSIQMFTGVLRNKRFELSMLAIFMGFLIFIASTAIYMFENEKMGGQINNLYDAFYWAVVTMSTVGYGDLTPVTQGGRLVTTALIISGLGLMAFFTSIMVAAFSEKMNEFQQDRVKASIEKLDNSTIVCGFGRVGQDIARQLQEDQQSFVIIDNNEQHIALAKHQGYIALFDDATQNSTLTQAGINQGAKAILCATGDDVANVYITLTSRYLNPDITIIARASHEDNVKKMHQAGASYTVQSYTIAGLLAAEYIGHPVAFEAINGILHGQQDVQMEVLNVHSGCFLDGKSIEQANFAQYKARLIGVASKNPVHARRRNRYKLRNQHFYFNPDSSFILYQGDILVLIGRHLGIEYLHDLIATSCLHKQQGKSL
ncbi:voltage-gated potassium channel [Bathymodiolus japonicus methanotrophic gill symbiont]|uniref:NAD-binding protein n=1 Tax=Bathymodiolus japonicus methanotrophic gill symbiont TaxID=113269 RepID=UPI001B531095|nr:NAD-binding protein [Bathymodiolus japonicus methanotrophic gill symbiont]GFO72057.1 voltage-gated potassium channel [Bathymodiolus japonicus methanotrophic gill symbiont]